MLTTATDPAAKPAVFTDFPDDLDDVLETAAKPAKPKYVSACWKCGGSGAWNAPTSLGHHRCTACNGRGVKEYVTSPEERAKARAARAAAKARKAEREAKLAEERLAKFRELHPEIAAWMESSDSAFAASLRHGVRRFGALTERQLAAAQAVVAKIAAARAEREAGAKPVDVSVIASAFDTARCNGLMRPRLRLAGFVFSLAGAGKNPGAIYVKQGETYLGKIVDGRFYRSRDCAEDVASEVVRVASDPAASAVAYGRMTGKCSVCGRLLENQESIDRGIGPICARKFGW